MNEREANPNPFVLQSIHNYIANNIRYIAFIRSLSKKKDHTVRFHTLDSANLQDAEMILKAVGELRSDIQCARNDIIAAQVSPPEYILGKSDEGR
jgi:hypothetical protein